MSEAIETPPSETETQKFQTVLIYFSNGTVGSFTGKALFEPEETEGINIENIKFLPPQDLPEGCIFEPIEEDDEEDLGLPEVIAGHIENTEDSEE
jgi:hypothetical protein|tara:strand:+ start:599 stop:883 length:285 start_codon:yes stop_codon:yes gene_type:complete